MNSDICLNWFISFAITIALASPVTGLAQTEHVETRTYCYKMENGYEAKTFRWHISYNDGRVEVMVDDSDQRSSSICRENGETLYWSTSIRDESTVQMERIGNRLSFIGVINGQQFRKTETIDDHPWFQPLSYSLHEFLISKDSVMCFWSVRPDTFDVVLLSATKTGSETLVFGGLEVPAKKVEIRIKGFFAPFWHGTYWYRLDDLLFLQYRGVNGPPGTAETLIRLLETCD